MLNYAEFTGIVQVDGYPGFERLWGRGKIRLAACWAHAWRKFYEVHEGTGSPMAAKALQRIAGLYAIDAAIRGQSSDNRRRPRQTRSLPLVGAMKLWLEQQIGRVPPRGAIADAIRYALARWDGLCLFSMTDASRSTTTRSSGPSGRSHSAVRTTCSPAPMEVPRAGPSWLLC